MPYLRIRKSDFNSENCFIFKKLNKNYAETQVCQNVNISGGSFFHFYIVSPVFTFDQIRGFFRARSLILSQNGLFLPTKQPWMGDNVRF